MDLLIRPMRLEDIPAGMRLCGLSRWNQLAEDWRLFLDSPGGGGRLAECDGVAVGTAAYLRYGPAFSWLSMMLVDPQARRAGIGSRLMEAVLAALEHEACVRLDATPVGEPLYRRFGFQGEFELVRASITAPTRPAAPLPDGIRSLRAEDWPVLLARDRQVFAADRSTLLASLYRRAPELGFTLWRGAALAGYCFGRPGCRYRQLGPIVAEDQEAARALIASGLAAVPGEQVAVDVPRSAPGWIEWLETVDFTVERPFLRMFRGAAPPPGQSACQFAIAGPEFG